MLQCIYFALQHFGFKKKRKIELLVYKLYGLSYDEVRIVDPDTDITEEEYIA